MKTLRLILGDQLNRNHSWFRTNNPDITYVMMEVRSETDYVRHHIQKVMAIFMAMRQFAEELRSAGHKVHYLHLMDDENKQNITKNIQTLIEQWGIEKFEYLLPDEYRLDEELRTLADQLAIPTTAVDTEHFFCERPDLKKHFEGRKSYLMESFYRMMRRKTGYLMQHGEPEGGRWNYDTENRSSFPAKAALPESFDFENDGREIFQEIQQCGVQTIGQWNGPFINWPINREQALAQLAYFCSHLLPLFGQYQDAMTVRHRTLFHSKVSFALNIKMLSPREVVEAALDGYRKNTDKISLAQIEGFVRQILGWREYMRGIYWAEMPHYAELNVLDLQEKLPEWYWTGNTSMNCLKHAIRQSLEDAYAHHIQRLMVTGNFALLLGVHPKEVDEWYLGIYADAFEWVQLPNTRGMSQYADGGIVGSKPYVCAANFIGKMSDYCSSCVYNPKLRTEENACPLNALYWDFYLRHYEHFRRHPRVNMAYRTLDKMSSEQKAAIIEKAAHTRQRANQL
jgi:deoxyribodipyrimidine photolyase-related protein